jgi:hypothetical protein
MPPFIFLVAIATGAVVAGRALRREWNRVNRELDGLKTAAAEATTLRRDPMTGVWRPE